jgi:hypothetical protein
VSNDFPPQPDHAVEVEQLAQAFASVIEGRTALYVSSPLTTGSRAFEWHQGFDRPSGQQLDGRGLDDFRRDVIEPNRIEAAAFVRKLRESGKGVVIDPTAMKDLPGWTQADYRVFWGRVIEGYAEAVVFRNGWMHSSGCAYEFFVAYSAGIRLLNGDLTPLSLALGRSLIAMAASEAREKGARSEFLQQVVRALDSRPVKKEAG